VCCGALHSAALCCIVLHCVALLLTGPMCKVQGDLKLFSSTGSYFGIRSICTVHVNLHLCIYTLICMYPYVCVNTYAQGVWG